MDNRFEKLTNLLDQQDRSSFGAWAAWDFVNGLVEQVYGVGIQEALDLLDRERDNFEISTESELNGREAAQRAAGDGYAQEGKFGAAAGLDVSSSAEKAESVTEGEHRCSVIRVFFDGVHVDNVFARDDDVDKVCDAILAAPLRLASARDVWEKESGGVGSPVVTFEIDDDGPEYSHEESPVKVYAVSAGGVKHEVYSGDLDECKRFCEDSNWAFKDGNDFVWDLEIEDSRDDLLPEDYFTALDYYSDKVGRDIENEFVRAHAEELVYCFHNEKEIVDFDFWTQYETLLGEKISFEEYRHIDREYDGDPMEIEPEDQETIGNLRVTLGEFRERDPHLFTCLGDKQFMFLVKAVNQEDAEKTGEKWYTKTFFEPGRFDCWSTKKEDYEDLDTQDAIESKAYQRMAKEKSGLVGSLADNIKEAEGLKKEPENIEQEVCKVTFRRTLGVGLGEFDVYLNIVPEEYKGKNDGFLLSVDERCLAYEKAAEVAGDEDLSDFVIFTAEVVQAPKERLKAECGDR